MFTPRRPFPVQSITPENSGKSKMVEFSDVGRVDSANSDDWRRFREVGLLDEKALERRDREAVLEKNQNLERELLDYQYNMGLLLIEQREWTSKCEKLQEALSEAHEVLKREQMSHLIAVSQMEDREENLKKALDVERQRGDELERSLRGTLEELEKTKVASETKLAYANDLVAGVEDRSLDVQEKLSVADAKLAEASTKTWELVRKLQEVDIRDNILKREQTSFNSERSAHQAAVLKQKEDIQERERKVKEDEDKVFESQRSINEREEKAMEFSRMLNQKQRELEEAQRRIDFQNHTLREMNMRNDEKLEDLTAKQEQLEKKQLEMNKDIEELHILNQTLKSQKQQFKKERNDFLAFVKTLKSCQNCGDMTKDYVLSDLHITKLDDVENLASASVIQESQGYSGKAAGKVQQKRTSSRMAGSEDSEGHSESVAERSRKKRHQTGLPSVQTAGEPRYNLRRHKASSKAVDSDRKSEKQVGHATATPDNEITYIPPGEVDNEDNNPTALVKVTSNKILQTQTVSSSNVVKTSEIYTDALKATKNTDSNEEVDEYNNEEDEESTSHENVEDSEDEHPGKSSITKKLWTFLTT